MTDNNIPKFVNSDSFMADNNYIKWLSDLKRCFHYVQLKAALKVNTEMLKFYWGLGEDIYKRQRQYKWWPKLLTGSVLICALNFQILKDSQEQTCMT